MQQLACATFPTLALGGNLVMAGFGFGFGFGFGLGFGFRFRFRLRLRLRLRWVGLGLGLGLELGLSPWWHTPVRTSYLIRVRVRVKAAC